MVDLATQCPVDDPEPSWLRAARRELGVREIKGGPNARIAEYIASVDGKEGDDWCSAFVQWVFGRAGIPGTGKRAARSWRRWGKHLPSPLPGCVVVLWRNDPSSWQGHVGLFLEETPKTVTLLGGNQGQAVSIRRYPKSRVLAYRWPKP